MKNAKDEFYVSSPPLFLEKSSCILFSTQPRLCVSRFPATTRRALFTFMLIPQTSGIHRVEIRDRKISHAIFSAITHAYDRGKGRATSRTKPSFTFSRGCARSDFSRARKTRWFIINERRTWLSKETINYRAVQIAAKPRSLDRRPDRDCRDLVSNCKL